MFNCSQISGQVTISPLIQAWKKTAFYSWKFTAVNFMDEDEIWNCNGKQIILLQIILIFKRQTVCSSKSKSKNVSTEMFFIGVYTCKVVLVTSGKDYINMILFFVGLLLIWCPVISNWPSFENPIVNLLCTCNLYNQSTVIVLTSNILKNL